MKYGLTAKDLKFIINVLSDFESIQKAFIFGSRAMGNYKKGSDVDIAVKGAIADETLLKIKSELENNIPLPYFFDVVDYDHLENQDLKKHIDQYGQLIYQK